jgi:hypothetical protein
LALPALFVLLALPLCLVLAPLIPTAETPDEGAHVLRADSLLHGDLIGARAAIPTPDGPRVEALLHGDPGLRRLMLMALESPPVGRAAMQALRWGGEPELYPAQSAAYPPIFYAPSALGLLAGRWTDAPPLDALFAARIANALAFVLVGGIALALARRGRLLMLAMLCLPMTLWLAASVHPDAPMLACLALVAALVGRWLAGERARGRSVWIGAVLLGCVIALKPSLVPTAGLLLLPLRRAAWVGGGAAATRICAAGLALALGLGWTAYAQREVAVPFVRGQPYTAGPLFPGPAGRVFRTTDASAQLGVLAADPLRLVTLPLRTMRDEADTKAREAIGVLGRLDLPLPGWLYGLWAAALAGAVLGDMLAEERREGPRVQETLLILAIGVACLFATYLALYLTWTPVGAKRIEGVQGRYLLPLLPLLGLALPRVAVPRATALRVGCTAIVVLAGLASVAILPVLAVRAYHAS